MIWSLIYFAAVAVRDLAAVALIAGAVIWFARALDRDMGRSR